MFRCEA